MRRLLGVDTAQVIPLSARAALEAKMHAGGGRGLCVSPSFDTFGLGISVKNSTDLVFVDQRQSGVK